MVLERNLYDHLLARLLWERQFEKILLKHGWGKFEIENVSSYTVKKDYSFLCMWMTWHWLERDKILIRCGNYSTKKSIWENQHLSWICILGLHSTTMRNEQRYCGQFQKHVRIANFRGENRKASILWKSSSFFMVLWYGWSCKEVCGTILWVGK